MARRRNIVVFAPVLHLTITTELGRGSDEIHIHPGGQGFWIARMLRQLGERPLLVGPAGGEIGRVLKALIPAYGIDFRLVGTEACSPAYVYDRRGGDRVVAAETAMPILSRHEIDEVYGTILEHAMRWTTCVITGQTGGIFPGAFYRRLGADLDQSATAVVGDLHGTDLDSFLAGGSIDILKISDEELEEDGLLPVGSQSDAVAAALALHARGARSVVISRGSRPAIAHMGGRLLEAVPPALDPADFRGAGDSMTAGFAAALARGLDGEGILRLGCAAGAANVTRHGLGSGSTRLIEALVDRIEIRSIAPVAA